MKIFGIDLQLEELKNFLVHKVAGDPGSPADAQAWYDTVAHRFKGRANGATKTFAHLDEITGASFDNPVASAVGDTMAQGVDTDSSRADHRHAREAFGSPAGSAVGDSSSNGTGIDVPHANHVHAREGFGTPGASAVGDSAANGAATTLPRSDHVHGREGFAAPTAQTTFGASTATGTAATLPHSDHAHGTPAHDAGAHSAIKISDLAAPSTAVAFNAQRITDLADPSAAQDAVTKAYADGLKQGIITKDPARLATAAALPAHTRTGNVLTASANGALSVDGTAVANGDRVLVKDEGATHLEHGWFDVTDLGSGGTPWVLTRTADADASAEVRPGAASWVMAGTANGGTRWVLTTPTTGTLTLNTTAIGFTLDFAAVPATAGSGLVDEGSALGVGEGFGIDVAADLTSIDKTLVPIFKTGLLGGAGPATSYTVTNPGFAADRKISVEVIEESTGETIIPSSISRAGNGDFTVAFGASSVAGTAYRYLAHGLAA